VADLDFFKALYLGMLSDEAHAQGGEQNLSPSCAWRFLLGWTCWTDTAFFIMTVKAQTGAPTLKL
jgi:hypothetical protein